MRIGFPLAAWLILAAAPAVRAQSKPADAIAAQVTFPAGERGRLAHQWFDAYNGGAEAAYRKFMETNAETGDTPIDARVERFGQMRHNLGNLTLLDAKETADGIELKVRTAKGDEGTVTVMIGATPPFKFQAVRVAI